MSREIDSNSDSNSLTQFAGTTHYMSKQIMFGKDYTFKTDIWYNYQYIKLKKKINIVFKIGQQVVLFLN